MPQHRPENTSHGRSLLVIHIGAGCHSPRLDHRYKKLLRGALKCADYRTASQVIEASPLTNSGYGSSFDRAGSPSSDVAVVVSSGSKVVSRLALLGVTDQASPTSCAARTLEWLERQYATESPSLMLGLSKPVILDYKLLQAYLADQNSPTNVNLLAGNNPLAASPQTGRCQTSKRSEIQAGDEHLTEARNSIVSKRARASFSHFQERLRESSPVKNLENHPQQQFHGVQDTVGYIELLPSTTGSEIVVASSSGGNFYRLPGRVSCAGIIGAGISHACYGDLTLSCMCSGSGDDIISTSLASYLCDSVGATLSAGGEWPDLGPLLVERISTKFAQVTLTAVDDNLEAIAYVGTILAVSKPSSTRLVFCHSTESFYFGFRVGTTVETVLSKLSGPVGTFLHGEYKLQHR